MVKQKQRSAKLSPRQLEIIELIAQGYSNEEIAEKLIISTHTVKAHIRSIFDKTNVTDRCQLVTWCFRQGILK